MRRSFKLVFVVLLQSKIPFEVNFMRMQYDLYLIAMRKMCIIFCSVPDRVNTSNFKKHVGIKRIKNNAI